MLALLTRPNSCSRSSLALFVAEYASSLIQIAVFKITKRVWPTEKGTGRRVFKMLRYITTSSFSVGPRSTSPFGSGLSGLCSQD